MTASADDLGRLGARLLADTELRRAAKEFLDAAAAEGILVAPIKGLVVSAELYDDPLDRPFADVDALATRRDVTRIVRLARRTGWRVVFDSKQLGCVNVMIPPGLPIDVRSSIGPPMFARVTAEEMLARATRRTDPRVVGSPFLRLADHDHFLVLLVDALMDKLALRPELRRRDLAQALAAWVHDDRELAREAREAGLSVTSHVVLEWLAAGDETSHAASLARALEPLPRITASAVPWVERQIARDTMGPRARVGIRLLSDSVPRAVASLALGAVGSALFVARHRGRRVWREGILWRGPES